MNSIDSAVLLASAMEKLKSDPIFPIDALPITESNPIWSALMLSPYFLTLPEMSALQKETLKKSIVIIIIII